MKHCAWCRGLFFFSAKQGTLFVAEAGSDVVVHHTHRLHERIAGGWANKLESLFLQDFAHVLRLGRPVGHGTICQGKFQIKLVSGTGIVHLE